MTRADAVLDRHLAAVRAFLVLGPPLIGAYPFTGLINPFWGSLFGFPSYLAAAGHPVYGPHPWTELAAFLLWPLVMLAAMTVAAGGLLAWQRPWRVPLVPSWIASAFAVLPIDVAVRYFNHWPIYGAFE